MNQKGFDEVGQGDGMGWEGIFGFVDIQPWLGWAGGRGFLSAVFF